MDIKARALEKHYEWAGKLEIVPRCKVENSEDLSLAYTPGVAEPGLAIRDDYDKSFKMCIRDSPCAGCCASRRATAARPCVRTS